MAQQSGKTTVRRITATDDAPKKTDTPSTTVTKRKPIAKIVKPAVTREEGGSKNPLGSLGRYFTGAWYELKQVRWPTRSATWSMTGAVLLFTALFVVLIILLDAGFSWMFERLLK